MTVLSPRTRLARLAAPLRPAAPPARAASASPAVGNGDGVRRASLGVVALVPSIGVHVVPLLLGLMNLLLSVLSVLL